MIFIIVDVNPCLPDCFLIAGINCSVSWLRVIGPNWICRDLLGEDDFYFRLDCLAFLTKSKNIIKMVVNANKHAR